MNPFHYQVKKETFSWPFKDKCIKVSIKVCYLKPYQEKSAKGCAELWKDGARISSRFRIQPNGGSPFDVHCDFTSETGWIWTLVMSQSHANRAKPEFLTTPLSTTRLWTRTNQTGRRTDSHSTRCKPCVCSLHIGARPAVCPWLASTGRITCAPSSLTSIPWP